MRVQVVFVRAVVAGVPLAWFAADEEFGQNLGPRSYLEAEDIAYAIAHCLIHSRMSFSKACTS
jgi:hypothetical protein